MPRPIFTVLIPFLVFHASAQQPSDSAAFNSSVSNIRRLYFSQIGDNAQIYHGTEYIRNGAKATGFPYLQADSMLWGTIYYQGSMYPPIKLYYNLVSDDLIIYDFSGGALINLSSEKVDSFSIGQHLFIRLFGTNSNGLTAGGYYEQLVAGEPALYARRVKTLKDVTGSEESKYVQTDYYFVRMNSVYYEVRSKNSILDLFKDKYDPMKTFIHSNKLDFKKNAEQALAESTIYYFRLKQ
jgi:hypothetical protein